MKAYFKKFFTLFCVTVLCNPIAVAQPAKKLNTDGPVEERAKKEKKIPPDYFAIAFYKPNYILPFYYTGSPYNSVYQNSSFSNRRIKNAELKFQLSLKMPVWKNIRNSSSSLFFAYTQLSYWQLYNGSPFFRESNYEPEFFLANEINWPLFRDWEVNFINAGLVHQSNGYGNALQRGWDRFYLEAITSNDNWMVSLKPWYVLSTSHNNDDITHYLGHGSIIVAYKYNRHVFSLQAHNVIENIGRASAGVTWSFPVTSYIKGYVQVFSGYGQSLVEYNHRTNSVGVGIAFNDWV